MQRTCKECKGKGYTNRKGKVVLCSQFHNPDHNTTQSEGNIITMAVKPNLSALFKKAAKTFGEAVEASKSVGSDFDDGKYVAKFVGFEIKQADNEDGTWGVLFQWLILEGDRIDDIKYEWQSLFDYEDAEMLSRFLIKRIEVLTETDAEELIEAFQADPDNWLENVLQEALDAGQVWQLKFRSSKSGFQNVDCLRQLDGADFQKAEKPTGKSGLKAAGKAATVAGKGAGGAKAKAEPEPEPEPDAPFEEGAEVKWSVTTGKGAKAKTEEFTGTVVDCEYDSESESWTVNVDTGETAGTGKNKKPVIETLDADELELVEVDPDTPADFEEGDEVKWSVTTGKGPKAKTEEFTGTIYSIDTEAETAEVQTGGTAKKPILETVDISELEKVEDESEPDEPAEAPFEEGDAVKWSVTTGKGAKAKTEEFEGEVWSVDTESETCEVKTGGTAKKPVLETVDFSDLQKVGDEPDGGDPDDYNFSEGDEVSFMADDEELTGEITEIDNENQTLTAVVKVGKKKVEYEVAFSDVILGEELAVGQTVAFVNPKTNKQVMGTLQKLDDDKGQGHVLVGSVTHKVDYDKLTIMKPNEETD